MGLQERFHRVASRTRQQRSAQQISEILRLYVEGTTPSQLSSLNGKHECLGDISLSLDIAYIFLSKRFDFKCYRLVLFPNTYRVAVERFYENPIFARVADPSNSRSELPSFRNKGGIAADRRRHRRVTRDK